MKRINDFIGEWWPVLCLLALLFLFCGVAVADFLDTAKCLELGYPEMLWANEEIYCIRFEDGSEMVRPLGEIEGQ